jgi:hypothetical protein
MEQRPLRPGDRVKLNGCGEGRVLRLIGDMADVVEFRILGRRAVWRLQIEALTLAPTSMD